MRLVTFVCAIACLLFLAGVLESALTTLPQWTILVAFALGGVVLSAAVCVLAKRMWDHEEHGYHISDRLDRHRPLG